MPGELVRPATDDHSSIFRNLSNNQYPPADNSPRAVDISPVWFVVAKKLRTPGAWVSHQGTALRGLKVCVASSD
jgi:hypothetical protein